MSATSPLRRDQANAVRERILVATIEVIEAGGEPSMRAVAQAAEISERTIYRYFASRDELQSAVVPILRERAGAPMAENIADLPDYIRRLFTTFDQNAQLARALTRAAWVPTNVSRPENLRALRKLIDAAYPQAAKADRESAAASLRVLLSASGWAYLADCGFDLETSIRHVQWMTRTVTEKLCNPPRGPHARN
jgi:AcrR family transcriptional regulator